MKTTRRSKIEAKDPSTLVRTASQVSDKSEHMGDEGAAGGKSQKVLLVPADQVQLNEAELNEEFTRILNANNPRAAQNISRYIFKDKAFKSTPNVEHHVIHFEFDGYMLFKEEKRDEFGESMPTTETNTENKASAATEEVIEEINEEGEVVTKKVQKASNKNQFNFSDRATQTINPTHKERLTNTEPPPQKVFSASVTQWEIYDTYMDDQQMKEKAAKDKSKAGAQQASGNAKGQKEEKTVILPAEVHNEDIINRIELLKSSQILERMANQNTFDDVAQDYKYWEGTLLPLWTFSCDEDKRKQVTSICWNAKFDDMFAVGYGSYDFLRQGPGLIACFSLKNPSYPEFTFGTDSGVMCLDFHKQKPSLIAVGLYDGTVCVFDIEKKSKTPIYVSSANNGKHLESVWQVTWGSDDLDGNLNFYSISADGRVSLWTLLKNELVYTDVIKLSLVQEGDAKGMFGFAAGTSFSFSPTFDHLFVVGTEEGKIHKCSKTYHNEYLKTFEGHQMSVYSVKYNPFSGKCFLSSSADWTLKLWDHDLEKPVLIFDLNAPVGDIAWAPYSATIFAAVTADGKVYVYDLNENKYEPICEQQIVKKAKLTHLSFSAHEPLLLVGDDKGIVVSLKLSPNLRKRRRASDDTPENERIERIMSIVSGVAIPSNK